MRLIVLALSLGTGIMSLIHGAIEIGLSPEGTLQAAGAAGFTWLTYSLLGAAAFFALIGGILAFNRRRSGGIFLLAAAALCFFAHRDFRIHGGLYLAGGVLAFFCRRDSRYGDGGNEDFDEDEDDDEIGEEDDYPDEDGAGDEDEFGEEGAKSAPTRKNAKHDRSIPAGGRIRERAFRIGENKESYRAGKDSLSKLNEPVRLRSSKVCPVCGASVGIEHKFCYSCGTPLHTARPAEPAARSADIPPSSGFSGGGENAADTPRRPEPFSKFEESKSEESRSGESKSEESKTDEERFTEERERARTKENLFGEGEFDGEGEEDFVPQGAPEPIEIPSPNKVFVKPVSSEDAVPKRPISIDSISPDNAYHMFGNYTRRRKYRRRSLPRRILGAAVLLAAVGGTAWFLLDLRTVPEDGLPGLPPEKPQIAYSEDIAVPDREPASPEEILAALRIDAPSRGIVTGANVNVRPNHSTRGAIVTKLNQGDRADVLGQWQGVSGSLSGAWYRIRLSDREGWIYGQYFQPLDARPATLPPGYTALLLKAFGSGREELTGRLGQPARETPTALTWPGLAAALRNGGEVTRLQVTSAKHVFQNGIAVGITDEMLYKSVGYPSEYRSGQLLYLEGPNQGVSVQMRNGKVQNITVGNI
ncbi:MAG: SH3 domain-containing protein [Synergistaceae bacterium]|jgi:hypothetical protein|nr:SH3 domain-containing protein [Synergistaceae bacterium]